MTERVYVCEWCHQFFTPRYRPSKKHKGEKPRFCNTSCSAKWRMSRPEFVRKLTTAKSRQASRENLKQTKARPDVQRKLADHQRSPSNPIYWPVTMLKARKASKKRGYAHLTGGNGTGLTVPQALLQSRLGWKAEHCVGVRPRRPGLPSHYKLDLAAPELKLAIEIDGQSHRTPEARRRDEKKTAYLVSQGWRVLRFRNDEVLSDVEGVIERVKEFVASTTSKPVREITSPTHS